MSKLAANPETPYPQAHYRFFADLQPIEGAIETVKLLLDSDTYEPYILSAPSIRNPFSYAEKREWVEQHLGLDFCERLILCAHKALLKGDILIDDNAEGRGQEEFEGILIHFGSDSFSSWAAIQASLGLKPQINHDHFD